MFIAQQKLKENVAEYLLYMWQIEDVIRGFNFDIEAIEFNFIRQHYQNDDEINALKDWYQKLIYNMKSEKIEQKGHLSELSEIMTELYYLHNTLLNISKDTTYISLHETAQPFAEEFRDKSNYKNVNDVELLLNALYAKFILRLKQQTITKETENAFESFRKVIAYLSKKYHQMKNGELNFHFN